MHRTRTNPAPTAPHPAPAGLYLDSGLNFESPTLRAVAAYWNGRRRGAAFPSRSDIRPADILPYLPAVMIVDVVGGGTDFRYRLIGTALTRLVGVDVTGRLMSESDLFPELTLRLRWAFQEALRRKAPLRTISERAVVPSLNFLRGENAVLPLSSDGAVIDKLLVGCDLLYGETAGGGPTNLVIPK